MVPCERAEHRVSSINAMFTLVSSQVEDCIGFLRNPPSRTRVNTTRLTMWNRLPGERAACPNHNNRLLAS